MKSDATLLASANTIKNETTTGANTASRVGSMLADLVNEKANIKTYRTKAGKPMLTLRLDDGLFHAYNWYQYLTDTENYNPPIKASIAVNTSPIDNEAATHITWEQAAEMEAGGWEIMSHGTVSPLDNDQPRICWQCDGTGLVDESPCPTCTTGGLFPLTPAQPGYVKMPYWDSIPAAYREQVIEEECLLSKQSIETNGCHVYGLVPPGWSFREPTAREIASKYYSSCQAGDELAPKRGNNPKIVDPYNICSESIDLLGMPYDYRTAGALDGVKALIDNAVTNNLWLVLYYHGAWGVAEFKDYLDAIIAYALASGVDIVTNQEALEECGAYQSFGANSSFNEYGAILNRVWGNVATIDENQTRIGYQAGYQKTDPCNTIIGIGAGYGIPDGSSSSGMVLIGYHAGNQQNSGSTTGDGGQLIAIGYQASYSRSGNAIFIGIKAGREAGTVNTPADIVGTIGIGTMAFYQATSCAFGVAIGFQAGLTASGVVPVFLGYQAGYGNSGANCVFIGYQAGKNNTEASIFAVHHENADDGSPLIKGYFASGGIILGCPTTALADATMGKNRVTFWHDEAANKIYFKVKYNDGTTIKTGELAIV